MAKSKQMLRTLRTLASEKGYTLQELADELEDRGWNDVAVVGQETKAAVHDPVHCCNAIFLVALEDVLGVTPEQTKALWRTMVEDVGEEVRRLGLRT